MGGGLSGAAQRQAQIRVDVCVHLYAAATSSRCPPTSNTASSATANSFVPRPSYLTKTSRRRLCVLHCVTAESEVAIGIVVMIGTEVDR
jgi:hypothetical protein